MFISSLQYARLPKEEDMGTAESNNADHRSWRRRFAGLPCGIALALSMIMNVLLLATMYSRRHPPKAAHSPSFPQPLYCSYLTVANGKVPYRNLLTRMYI